MGQLVPLRPGATKEDKWVFDAERWGHAVGGLYSCCIQLTHSA
jgi:hypothetical protein